MTKDAAPPRDPNARVCLITGPTSGLGREIATELARRCFQLVLLGRNEAKLNALAAECVAAGAPEPVNVVCDMSSQAEVRRAAAEVRALDFPLHALINNAGLINQRRRITADQLEETIAVGYFSAFLLTMELLPKLEASAPAMVVFTTSDTYPLGKLDFDDVRAEERFGPIRQYAASKLALVQLTRMLAKRLADADVAVNVYNPGMIYTNLAVGNNAGPLVRVGDFFWSRIARDVSEGIAAPLEWVTAEDLSRPTGQLRMRDAVVEMKSDARDPLLGSALWELSEQCTDVRASFGAERRATCPPGTLRIGVLGAARIAPFAVFKHQKAVGGVAVTAVAEEYQSFNATVAYARKHGIPKVYRTFEKLLADPEIDAVYVALPISLHERWTLAAIAAGKHVLCEKPLAANADEARAIHEAAAETNLVVMEAMHFRQHPLVDRVREILDSGEIGDVRRVRAGFSAYIPNEDFRFNYQLGGGCMIDMGCYPIAFLRAVLGGEPTVAHARADLAKPNIDGVMEAELVFPGDVRAEVFVGMRSLRRPLEVGMRFEGTKGSLDILNFIKPEVYHHVRVRSPRGKRRERVPGGSTYRTQLAAFVDSVKTGAPVRTTTDEAVGTLTVIDALYRAAGLPPRGT